MANTITNKELWVTRTILILNIINHIQGRTGPLCNNLHSGPVLPGPVQNNPLGIILLLLTIFLGPHLLFRTPL